MPDGETTAAATAETAIISPSPQAGLPQLRGAAAEEKKKAPEKQVCWQYDSENHQMRVNCSGCVYGTSIEDFEECFALVIDALMEQRNVSSVLLVQPRNAEYDYEQTQMLAEIAALILKAVREARVLSPKRLAPAMDDPAIPARMAFLQRLLLQQMRSDPIGAYVTLTRELRHLKIRAGKARPTERASILHFIDNALLPLAEALDQTRLIKAAQPYIAGLKVGDRAVYREIFHPVTRPNFMLTKYMMIPPVGGQEIDRYTVGETEVQIFKVPGQLTSHYHIIPPEMTLSEDEYNLLDIARQYLAEYRPTRAEFAQPARMREVFYNIGRDLLADIAETTGTAVDAARLDLLALILTRYTAGYGILEAILADERVQDIFINSPVGQTPVFLFHGDHEECVTNIIPTREDAEAWATRFRIESGRPLDEASPVLDTEVTTPVGRARVAAVTSNLSPEGLGFALRRHREKPWTYPLFIYHRMMNPLAAGLLSFLVDGARTMLFAGTRGTGKTSLLGSTLSEIGKRYRIVTVEDTLELPVEQLKALQFNVERLKSRSIITRIETELPMDEAIRVSLRLGDSALIIGEIRSTEAKALYEAMRIGALANVVAGTVHGDSPFGVYDRIVNDLGVPPTSFKATDVLIIANRLRTPDGLHSFRRITEITEQLKDWRRDPLEEKAFVPLLVYDAKKDELVPTDTLTNGESYVINEIARRVRDWKDNWPAVWDNIQLRTKVKETIVELARQTGNLNLLEATFVVDANAQFRLISERVREEVGALDSARIYELWLEWARSAARRLATAA